MQFKKNVIVAATAAVLIASSSVSARRGKKGGAMAILQAIVPGQSAARATSGSTQRAGQSVQEADVPNETRPTAQAVQNPGVLPAPSGNQGLLKEIDRLLEQLINPGEDKAPKNVDTGNLPAVSVPTAPKGTYTPDPGVNTAKPPTAGAYTPVGGTKKTDNAPAQPVAPTYGNAADKAQGVAQPVATSGNRGKPGHNHNRPGVTNPSAYPIQGNEKAASRSPAANAPVPQPATPQKSAYGGNVQQPATPRRPATGATLQQTVTPQRPAYGTNVQQPATPQKPAYGTTVQQTATPQKPATGATVQQPVTPQKPAYGSNVQQPATPQTPATGMTVQQPATPQSPAYGTNVQQPATPETPATGMTVQQPATPQTPAAVASTEQATLPQNPAYTAATDKAADQGTIKADATGSTANTIQPLPAEEARSDTNPEKVKAEEPATAAPAFLGDIVPLQVVNPDSNGAAPQSPKEQQSTISAGPSRFVEQFVSKNDEPTSASNLQPSATPSTATAAIDYEVSGTTSSAVPVDTAIPESFIDPVDGSDMRVKTDPIVSPIAPAASSPRPIISAGVSQFSSAVFSLILINILFF